MTTFLKKVSIFLILVFAVFLTVNFASAQPLDTGQEEVDEVIALEDPDPRMVAARIVQIALGFLGILALALIIYAGYIWMTAAGNSERVEKAKGILKNAIIGLLIILSAFGIVSFILSQLTGTTTPGGTDSGPGGGIGGGSGALGSCSLESVYPEPNQKEVPRNTSIIFTFRKEVDSSTVCNVAEGGQCDGENIRTDGRIKIYKSETDPEDDSNWVTDVSVYETDNHKTFVLVPDEYLGSPSEFIWYAVYLSNDIRERDEDKGVFTDCKADYYNWQFEVSNEIDLTPPQVKEKGVFPPFDNERDDASTTQEAQIASGGIDLEDQPRVYSPASSEEAEAVGGSPSAEVEMEDGCSQGGTLTVAVKSDGVTAQLSHEETLLGENSFSGSTVDFDGYLSLTVTDGEYNAGNSWEVEVNPMQEADTVTVGSVAYVFVEEASQENHIEVGDNISESASLIASGINEHSLDVNASSDGSYVDIVAEEAGEEGNDIHLSSSDDSILAIDPMSGGQDQEENVIVNDKPDQPRNSIIQINFDEAINPITVSGKAQDLSDYIRVKCDDDDDCSNSDYFFDCHGEDRCIKGEFLVSDQYSTVEFKSNNQCGTNACGQPIYCLPANSHPEVDLEAATLEECSGDDDCEAKAPYTDCSSEDAAISVCVDDQDTATTSDDINYPASDASLMDGIMDAALNSLDGNRDEEAQGPINYFELNDPEEEDRDNFRWSFFINDEIKIEPPVIESTAPSDDGSLEDLSEHLSIDFDSLMMSDSLSTGSTLLPSGEEEIEHKLINIWNYTDSAIGYWVTKNNIDSQEPLDGWPDATRAQLRHSMLEESVTYRTQAGSGVLDIYQNCFKPSSGPACSDDPVSETDPSCCAGEAVEELGEEGDCP
jgi:hypothetical protein